MQLLTTMATETDSTADSMAARLARQRQQRSMLRTSNLPLEEGENRAPSSVGSELQILRAEVGSQNCEISKLQGQLRLQEAEVLEIGQNTSRMEAELRQMQDRITQVQAPTQAPAQAPPAHEEPPMEVKIDLGADGDVSVEVSVSAR